MATVNQGMSVEEIEQIVAQRVANAIEAIAIYESINQTKQRENKVVGNASNKRKWEGDQNGSPNQQQNKEHKVFRAHSVGPNYKKEYLGSLPLCNKCKFHHIGLCAARCENCKWRGHQARDCRISGPKTKPRPSMAKLKAEVTCYECGELGHYKRDCPLVKFQNRVDNYDYWLGSPYTNHECSDWSTETRESQTRGRRRYDQEGYTKGGVGDRVMLKVSPWKGDRMFWQTGEVKPQICLTFKGVETGWIRCLQAQASVRAE
ncbi:putative reverse transcriptase domain-containing protein [Tanacetum coccineum]|uniref:Reverse transcriptase domain-containing protein n=1 Tax=Tanacetum coccineum TaxID=301880 RepID=A0ABQ4WS86_9ASTR